MLASTARALYRLDMSMRLWEIHQALDADPTPEQAHALRGEQALLRDLRDALDYQTPEPGADDDAEADTTPDAEPEEWLAQLRADLDQEGQP